MMNSAMDLHISNNQTDVLAGQELIFMPETTAFDGAITIDSSWGNCWSFESRLLSSHMLAIGGIGSGKTNLLYHIVNQIISGITDRDIIIFFDSKGDFLRRFYRIGDYVVGNSGQFARYQLSRWNLYKELSVPGSTGREDTIREIATSLFRKQIDSTKNPVFALGARDIFAAIIESQLRDHDGQQDNLSLRQMMRALDIPTIKSKVSKYPDLRWINMYMHSEGSATTQSFLTPLGSVVNDVFTAHFAEVGNFSIREAVHQRGGKSIFLEYDIVNSNLIDTVYTVLLDLASKEALGNEEENRYVYFVLDEFPLIPKLNYIDNLLNFGRSRGVRVIGGIQNVNQVKNMYGESLGTSILSGFSTCLAFRLFDEESRKFVSERHGKNLKLVRIPFHDAQQSGSQEYERGDVIEDWDVTTLKNGECLVSLPYGNPYKFFPALYPRPERQISIRAPEPRIIIKEGNS